MRLVRRACRAYRLWCAREDLRRLGLAVPAGVWVCAHCPRMTFDVVRLRQHVARAHA